MNRRAGRSQLGVVFLTVFIDLVGFSIIFPLFPDMLEYYFEKEGSEGLFGELMELLSSFAGGEGEEATFRTQVLFGGFLGSLYSTLQFIFATLWGSLSDRLGRKPVLLLTISGLALSYLAWFFSGTFALLIFARFFGGAMSGNIAVASAAIADSTDAKTRTKGMAIIGVAFGLGFILGPAIGGFLSMFDLSEPTDEFMGINPFSAPAGAAFLLSLVNVAWVKKRFRETLTPERRGKVGSARPLNPARLFHRYESPGINRANLANFIFLLAFAGMEFTLTFLAKERFAYDSADIAVMFVFVGLIIALVQGGLIRRLVPAYGEKALAVSGLLNVAVGFVLIGIGQNQPLLYTGLAFLAVGSALITPCVAALVSLYSPADRQGEIQGVFRSLGALARAVGPIAACALYFELGAPVLYIGGAILLLLPTIISAGLPPVDKT